MTIGEFIDYPETRTRGTISVKVMYVSPSATNGDGTLGNPYSWDQMKVKYSANTTVWLRGGTYSGVNGVFSVNGQSNAKILIKPYPLEHVKIDFDGTFSLDGAYTELDGSGGRITIYHSDWGSTRYSSPGNDAWNVGMNGAYSKMINCEIHDTGGVGNWKGAINSEVYGTLSWNIGQSTTGTHMYTQNGSTGYKEVSNNLMLRTYAANYIIHLYGHSKTTLKRYKFNNNIFVGGITLLGSYTSKAEDINFNDNTFIDHAVQFGQLGIDEEVIHTDIHFLQNTFLKSNITVKRAENYSIRENTFHTGGVIFMAIVHDLPGIDIDYNDYRMYTDPSQSKFYWLGSSVLSLPTWQGYGFDLNGSYDTSSNDFYKVIGNKYDNDRAIVSIANFSESATVEVDLSSLPLTIGRDYKLLNGQNPEESHDFTYDGDPLTITMSGWTVSQPLGTAGDGMPVIASTFPKYGNFYLVRDI